MHHASVKAGSVACSKAHDAKSMFCIVGSKEGQLILVAVSTSNLMVAAASIEADEVQFPGRVTKIDDGILTSGNGMFEGQG